MLTEISLIIGLVVGISCGVDSAVTGLLAVKALGKENVKFVHMPASNFHQGRACQMTSTASIDPYTV